MPRVLRRDAAAAFHALFKKARGRRRRHAGPRPGGPPEPRRGRRAQTRPLGRPAEARQRGHGARRGPDFVIRRRAHVRVGLGHVVGCDWRVPRLRGARRDGRRRPPPAVDPDLPALRRRALVGAGRPDRVPRRARTRQAVVRESGLPRARGDVAAGLLHAAFERRRGAEPRPRAGVGARRHASYRARASRRSAAAEASDARLLAAAGPAAAAGAVAAAAVRGVFSGRHRDASARGRVPRRALRGL
mmetsp:Transcript_16307/g.50625  ORF Transcript_16307/g.50625 Transcript_16307/m.50625 type:complete len:245 (-) Transcript_16307:835-1569(-)